jgi:hypothetical protein
MEMMMSGSVAMQTLSEEDIDESLELLMGDDQFEQDLINSFNDKMYVIKDIAPNPLWTLCSISMRMVKVLPRTEIVPLDEFGFSYVGDDSLIECLVGSSLIKIPKKYVQQGEWH